MNAQVFKNLLNDWDFGATWRRAICKSSSSLVTLIDSYGVTVNSVINPADQPLMEIFSHLRVNPSKKGRSEQIVGCHVFPADFIKSNTQIFSRKIDDKEKEAINFSKKNLEKFMCSIFDLSKKFRAENITKEHTTSNFSENTIFCIGDKGVGKTHLQNYMLSSYSKKFDEKRIIYIRLNLLRVFGDFDVSFLKWLKAQVTKIVCRYYDQHSNYFVKDEKCAINVRDRLLKYIDEHYLKIEERINRKKTMNIMLNELFTENIGMDISPDWLDDEFADQVWKYAKDDGYTFVVVFDGLDQLSGTYLSEEKKVRRLKQLNDYLSMESIPFNVLNIIFLRPDTYKELMEMMQELGTFPYIESMNFVVETVVPCTSKSIYSRRMEYLLNSLGENSISTKTAQEFDDFYRRTKCGLTKKAEKNAMSYYDAIEYLAERSPRSAIQLMRTAVIQFSQGKESEHKYYHFTETSMFGDMIYPPLGYAYEKKNGQLRRKFNAHNYGAFDLLFLPSIVSFPFDETEKIIKVFPDIPHQYLLGVRILQTIKKFDSNNEYDCIGVDLASVLTELYGYDPKITQLLLEEYSDFELISAYNGNNELPSNQIRDKNLKLTIKGEKILDQYIYDLTYLAISALTIQGPKYLLDSAVSDETVFLLKSPKIHKSKDWVIAKLINAFSLAKLLSWINDSQKQNISTVNRDRLTYLYDKKWRCTVEQMLNPNDSIYSISTKMMERMIHLSSVTLSGFLSRGHADEIIQPVCKYLQDFQKRNEERSL